MTENTQDIQQALKDIGLIRHALNQSNQTPTDNTLSGITLDANIILQAIAFGLALILALAELVTGNTMTETMLHGAQSPELVHFGIGLMGFMVGGLLVVLYFVLWRAARHHGEEFNGYIVRNFRYVHNLSLISDLLVKFATLALLMLAGKPQWIAPALMLFTGDYLLQGRFFTLPTKLSVCLGSLCMGLAFAEFASNSTLLVIPLVAFAVIAGISTGRLALRYRRQSAASA